MNAMQPIEAEVFPALSPRLCDLGGVKTPRISHAAWMLAVLMAGSTLLLRAETNNVSTNAVLVEHSSEKEAATKPTPAAGKLDYSSFIAVSERNIFNGNRSGQRMVTTRSSTKTISVRVESFSLVGTLLSEDKAPVAFFDGTGSEFRKTLKSGGTIGGFTVKEILHAGVRLAQGTNTLEVTVGSGMRREDAGLWKSSTTSTTYASSSSSASSGSGSGTSNSGRSNSRNGNSRNGSSLGRGNNGDSSAASSASTDSPPSAEVNEVLKKLMEKREKE